MGVSIYAYLEKRNPTTGDWQGVGTNLWVDGGVIIEPEDVDISRSYFLFAILAGVRNIWKLTPISEPRGLPTDCSREVRDMLDDGWYQPVSYLTLADILNYDWEQTITEQGIISFRSWLEWRAGERKCPDCYSRSVGAMGSATVNEEQATWLADELGPFLVTHFLNKGLIEEGPTKLAPNDKLTDTADVLAKVRQNPDLLNKLYVRAEWVESLKTSGYGNLAETVEKMHKLSERADLTDIRMVFGFDN